jgi:hypothetical protein
VSVYETWVHGTSGQVEPSGRDWVDICPFGWGLSLDGKVEDDQSPYQTWVHFHIPMTSLRSEAAANAPKLQKVMLRFATDFNPSGWFVHHASGNAVVKWNRSVGGAVIREVDLWDGERQLPKTKNVWWQSPNLGTTTEQVIDISPEQPVQHGLGISVHVRFLNQKILDMTVQSGSLPGYAPGDWDKKPFVYGDVATQTKGIYFSSVGCRYSATL